LVHVGSPREAKASLFYFLPPLLKGEGDKGGEVDKQPIVTSIARRYTMLEITTPVEGEN